MRGMSITKIFKFHSLESFKYIKFTQKKGYVDSSLSNLFCLRSVEIFGEIVTSNESNKNCRNDHHIILNLIFLVL